MKQIARQIVISTSMLAISTGLFIGCGGMDDEAASTRSDAHQYQFKINGCDTGKQKFKTGSENETLKNMCTTLIDDEANNNCAFESRCHHYDRHCYEKVQWERCEDYLDRQYGPVND